MISTLQYHGFQLAHSVLGSSIAQRAVSNLAVTRADHNQVADRLWQFGASEQFEFEGPVSTQKLPAKMSRIQGPIESPQPFVTEFHDTNLVGPDALTLTDAGPLLENALGDPALFWRSFFGTLSSGMLPHRTSGYDDRIDIAVSLVGPWCREYYHWYSEYLLRLQGLERYEEEFDVSPVVIVPRDPPDWMRATLRYAGPPQERWYEWDGGRVRVDRLVVPSIRRGTFETTKNHHFSPSAYRWLGGQIRDAVGVSTSGSERIYISREKAELRRVRNRNEVMEFLADCGFEKHVLEDKPLSEQVELVANATCIVGPSGAGFTNMIYGSDLTIVPLFGSDINACYPVMASGLGFDCGVLVGEATGVDMRIDVDELSRLLERLGIH